MHSKNQKSNEVTRVLPAPPVTDALTHVYQGLRSKPEEGIPCVKVTSCHQPHHPLPPTRRVHLPILHQRSPHPLADITRWNWFLTGCLPRMSCGLFLTSFVRWRGWVNVDGRGHHPPLLSIPFESACHSPLAHLHPLKTPAHASVAQSRAVTRARVSSFH